MYVARLAEHYRHVQFLVPGSRFRVRVRRSGSEFEVRSSPFRVPLARPVTQHREPSNHEPRTTNVNSKHGPGPPSREALRRGLAVALAEAETWNVEPGTVIVLTPRCGRQ